MSSDSNKQFKNKLKRNATPRKPEVSKKTGHVKASSRGFKPQPKKVIPKKPLPLNEYRCTVCASLVTKKNPAGKDAGLGRFKCVCGNKTVKVSRIKAVSESTEAKVAA